MSADAMIARAEKDLGLGEPNYIQDWYASRNGSAYSYNFAWCNAAITRWAHDSGNYAAVCPNGDRAYTVAHAVDFKSAGRWHYGTSGISPGSVVFFDWGGSNSISRIDHVGIVTRVSGGAVHTIEGNTGNRCLRRVRYASTIVGYGRPDYGASSGSAGAGKGAEEVPDFGWYSTDGGQTIPPGEWQSIKWENTQKDGKGTYWSVVFGESTYHLMAGVTLSGLPKGARVQLCAVHMDKDAGANLPDGILKKGASGPKVERVQEGLKELGYSLGGYGADGKYGGATEDALRAFQRDAGITVDGHYGPQTEEAMEHELGGGSGWYTKHWFAPSAPAVADSSGSVDVSYSIPERILKGKRVRIRVRHDSSKPAKVTSGNVYIHEWK